ncbi:MAG TPA: isoleucine--tRNA ligase [Verrucomicrobiae bacterium]|nr:isoleucine--tRNA ligase [Verrucomicrobiae bacterium]
MQASLAQREPQALARWQGEGLYAKIGRETAGRPSYWFVDGPPYANGDIHIGHCVNKVLKDIVVKAARLNGHHAAFIPGWDCHGLPIELQVEKKFGKVGDKLDAKTFREKCREYASEQVARQRADFERLGILADWDKPYLTMDAGFEAEQLRCLATIVERGHVVRGAKPVHWCLDCGSSLAEAEVEYEDKKSSAIDVKFAAEDPAAVAKAFGAPAGDAAFVIWTTTPWTLPANQAITVHPDFDYVLAEVAGQGRLVLVEPLLEAVAKRLGGEARVLGRAKGIALKGLCAKHPFAGRSVPIICGEHVTLEAGTGLVHTAPAHGLEDFVVGQEYKLPVDNPVGANGVFAPATPLVGGQHVRKADPIVIEGLKATGALAHLAEIVHSYPHCWRHKTPLIFRATPQWFVSMDQKGLRKDALAAIAATRWIPGWGEARIAEMVAGRPDWCISRQRYWGVPLALFVDKETGAMHPDSPALLRKVADRVAKEGLEVWFGSDAAEWLGADAPRYDKLKDTLDVWFDSGVVHQCAFATQAPEAMKGGVAPVADMYLEGSDQHRGWFMSSLLTSTAMHARSPYKAVLTHGFTVDEQGRKMSKSLGNVVAPQQVLKTLGADVLRLWVAASDYSGEIAISENLLKRIADAYRRIRNTVRYLLGNLHGFDPARDAVPVEQMLAVDRWALATARALQDELSSAYRDAQFHLVYQKVHNYAVDLGALYLDILKDRLYTCPRGSVARRSAQTAMFHIAEALVRWIAPVLSFTADEIWLALPGERSASVFSQGWHALPADAGGPSLDWDALRRVRLAVAKVLEDLRVKGAIGQSLAAEVTLYADEPLLSALRVPGDELRFWFITSGAEVRPAGAQASDAVTAELEGGGKLWIEARACAAPKCERCWHRRPEVGDNKDHPGLCGRCVENVDGVGEARRYI